MVLVPATFPGPLRAEFGESESGRVGVGGVVALLCHAGHFEGGVSPLLGPHAIKVDGKQIGPVAPITTHYLPHYLPWDWLNLSVNHLAMCVYAYPSGGHCTASWSYYISRFTADPLLTAYEWGAESVVKKGGGVVGRRG